MKIADYLTTIKYTLSKKQLISFPTGVDLDILSLNERDSDNWDLKNLQVYTSGPTRSYGFILSRMENWEKKFWYEKYLMECRELGVVPRKTMCASAWLYYSENIGDYYKPRPAIDIDPAGPREVYFEIDLFETFRHRLSTRVSMSGHYGTQTDRKLKTRSILGDFTGNHDIDVVWDGLNNWTWFLDGVMVFQAHIPAPPNIFPWIKFTYGAVEHIPSDIDSWTWRVNDVLTSKTIAI